jgi:hypothetical protein
MRAIGGAAVGSTAGCPEDAGEERKYDDRNDDKRGSDIHSRLLKIRITKPGAGRSALPVR